MQMAAPDRFFDGPRILPLQRYFMNFGPWISPQSYLWQGLAILAGSAVFLIWLYSSKIQEELNHLCAAVGRKNDMSKTSE
jgi:hypothetical protein